MMGMRGLNSPLRLYRRATSLPTAWERRISAKAKSCPDSADHVENEDRNP